MDAKKSHALSAEKTLHNKKGDAVEIRTVHSKKGSANPAGGRFGFTDLSQVSAVQTFAGTSTERCKLILQTMLAKLLWS